MKKQSLQQKLNQLQHKVETIDNKIETIEKTLEHNKNTQPSTEIIIFSYVDYCLFYPQLCR